ncbi:Palmitoyltransferase AKR1 [Nosema bombycis CQ1]|uniref:Palmitoyltransferase n=1 Tax=Nosema bombycis (strain CQ1 / CVCC 102059) TaxID=578461 RepID=R0MMD7_NOSB1|nr:Palmitoyltransferase AKR1 [Nosema bombycis CQ1]|eukprot:EOB14013.1 Palmitoyltransferase AKR1 [Nosema bombycis CQ1]
MNINKIREAKYLISDLVLKDKYNSDYFCIACINQKHEKTQHCDVCKRCVCERIYHCSFLKKCITEKNRAFFSIYCVVSIFLYLFAIEFNFSKSFFDCFINLWVLFMFIGFFLKANFVFNTETRYYNLPNNRTGNIETYPLYTCTLSTLSSQRRNTRA